MAGICFTSRYNGISRELKNVVTIATSVGNKKVANNKIALWDTGANCSVITNEIAEELGLVSLAKRKVNTPSGSHEANVYYIDVKLPSKLVIPKLQVCSGISHQWDILIGMDIISMGDFAVSNFNGKTTFTFRLPSLDEADFVNKSNLKP